jgi:hypothetical protein
MHPGFIPKNHPNQQKKQGADDSVDDRETPRDVYNPLHAEFGFTLDVAAAHHNRKCELYCTLGGLHANIDGRIAAVHEEDEMGGGLSDLDWSQAPEGVWLPVPPQAALASEVARPSFYLRLQHRRYTARFDGVSLVRHAKLRKPQTSFPWDERGQYEGLLSEGSGARDVSPGSDEREAEGCSAQNEVGRELEARPRRAGLEVDWSGHTVWVNPPFSDLKPWVHKAHRTADCTVAMLLPANRTEQPFWQRYIEPYRDGNARDYYWREIIRTAFNGDRPAGEVKTRFVDGRRSFLIQDEVIGNTTSKNPPFGIVLVIWDRRPLSRATRTYHRLRAAMEAS